MFNIMDSSEYVSVPSLATQNKDKNALSSKGKNSILSPSSPQVNWALKIKWQATRGENALHADVIRCDTTVAAPMCLKELLECFSLSLCTVHLASLVSGSSQTGNAPKLLDSDSIQDWCVMCVCVCVCVCADWLIAACH